MLRMHERAAVGPSRVPPARNAAADHQEISAVI
jgi:hypothetical protein